MKHFEDVIHYYYDRIAAIRKDATAEIIALLKKHNLTTLILSENEEHQSFVVWMTTGGGYDCVVKSVTIDDEKDIELELYHHDLDYCVTVSSKYSEIFNAGWLPDILSSMVYTLTSKQQNDGE